MSLPTILIEDSQTILEILIPALDEIADAQVMAVAGTAAEGVAAMSNADGWRLVVVDLFLKEIEGARRLLRALQDVFERARPRLDLKVCSSAACAL